MHFGRFRYYHANDLYKKILSQSNQKPSPSWSLVDCNDVNGSDVAFDIISFTNIPVQDHSSNMDTEIY